MWENSNKILSNDLRLTNGKIFINNFGIFFMWKYE